MSDSDGRRGQVESIGTALLIAVVVTSATAFGVFYFGSVAGQSGPGADGGAVGDSVSVDARVTQDGLSLSHTGGRSLAVEDLRVVVRNDTGEVTSPVAADDIRDGGGENGAFDAGETWHVDWSRTGGEEVTVTLVDDETNSVVFDETLVIPEDATARPSNAAVGEDVSDGDDGDDGDGDDGDDGDDGEEDDGDDGDDGEEDDGDDGDDGEEDDGDDGDGDDGDDGDEDEDDHRGPPNGDGPPGHHDH